MGSAPQTIDEFVGLVLDQDASLRGVDAEVRQQLKADYVEDLDNRIKRAIIDALPEDQLAAAEMLLDNSPMADLQSWIGQRVPNVSDLVARVLLRWKDEYVGG